MNTQVRQPRTHRRLPNPRLVKIHRNYSAEEIAALLGVHKNTVREWLRRGLPALKDRRPMLILGRDLSEFLTARRKENKRPCQSGEIYCVRCRRPQKPAGSKVQYIPLTVASGNLIGICPECNTKMYRRISATRLNQELEIQAFCLPLAREHIVERRQPSVSSDFKQE